MVNIFSLPSEFENGIRSELCLAVVKISSQTSLALPFRDVVSKKISEDAKHFGMTLCMSSVSFDDTLK